MKRLLIAASAAVLAGCTTTTVIVNDKEPSVAVEAPSIYSYATVWRKAHSVLAEVCASRKADAEESKDGQEADIADMSAPKLMAFLPEGTQMFNELKALHESAKGFFGKTTVTLAVKCPSKSGQ